MKYNEKALVTVVEFDGFTRFATKHMDRDAVDDVKALLSAKPEAGVVIAGTGGVRKLRWAAKGKGKSGGVRIIYYYHSTDMPLLLLTGFAKSEMENISKAAANMYQKMMPILIGQYLVRGKNGKKEIK